MPGAFTLILTMELRRRQCPRYPEREFWRALELADNADLARAIAALNAEEDADYFVRQRSYEFGTDLDFDPSTWTGGIRRRTRSERPVHAVLEKSSPAPKERSVAHDRHAKASHSDPGFCL